MRRRNRNALGQLESAGRLKAWMRPGRISGMTRHRLGTGPHPECTLNEGDAVLPVMTVLASEATGRQRAWADVLGRHSTGEDAVSSAIDATVFDVLSNPRSCIADVWLALGLG